MAARTFDESKLPSRHMAESRSCAPHRSSPYAMGLTEVQIRASVWLYGGSFVQDHFKNRHVTVVDMFDAVGVPNYQVLKAPNNKHQSGVLQKYADHVGPVRMGAVTHAGTAEKVVCYADI